MSTKIFHTAEVQDFLRLASGLTQEGGDARTKAIVHRILSDLFKAIEDLDISSDEYWAGIAYLNQLGTRGEAGLLSPGLGLDRYYDMRMDAEDAALGVENGTPRTIEGPLYVAGAPVAQGFARLDDGSDQQGHTLIMHGTVFGADGQPLPGASVEVWHANTKGFYSHFDPTGEQKPFNMRRTIVTDARPLQIPEHRARRLRRAARRPHARAAAEAGPARQPPRPHPLLRDGGRPSQAHHADQHRRRPAGA